MHTVYSEIDDGTESSRQSFCVFLDENTYNTLEENVIQEIRRRLELKCSFYWLGDLGVDFVEGEWEEAGTFAWEESDGITALEESVNNIVTIFIKRHNA